VPGDTENQQPRVGRSGVPVDDDSCGQGLVDAAVVGTAVVGTAVVTVVKGGAVAEVAGAVAAVLVEAGGVVVVVTVT
jgi:hypothetical protein